MRTATIRYFVAITINGDQLNITNDVPLDEKEYALFLDYLSKAKGFEAQILYNKLFHAKRRTMESLNEVLTQ